MATTKHEHEKKDSIDEYYEKLKESGSVKPAEKGSPKKGGVTRQFQVAPDRWESYTRDEAEAKGFFWGDIASSEVGRGSAPTGKVTPGNEPAT